MLINPWINDDNSCNILVISLFNMCLFNMMQIIANYSIPLLNIHVYIKHIYIEFYNDYGKD